MINVINKMEQQIKEEIKPEERGKMIDIVYANAYKEVIEVLKYVSKEDYDKIPQDKINLFKKCANENYNFTYDINKTLDEQNVSKKAKTIIAILYRDYWATDEQRKK